MPIAPQTTDELLQALQENDRRPYGRTRTVTAEELVEAAEQFEEPVPLIHALLELQEAYTYGSEPRKSPVVFARLLTLFDEQPDVFDERLRHTLFWRFKWVANALLALPEIPLTSLRQWQTEMRDRYEKAASASSPTTGRRTNSPPTSVRTPPSPSSCGRAAPAPGSATARPARSASGPCTTSRRATTSGPCASGSPSWPGRTPVRRSRPVPSLTRCSPCCAPAPSSGPSNCTSPATAPAAATPRWPGRSAVTWSSAR